MTSQVPRDCHNTVAEQPQCSNPGAGGRWSRVWSAAVAVGSVLAALGAVHASINARLLRTPTVPAATPSARIAILIPVRNEALRIGACLRAVELLSGADIAEVLVMDDGSDDGTPAVLRAIADHWAGPPLRLLTASPVPPGWLGKPAACAQLAEAARADCEVLVFLDADVRLECDSVAASVALLRDLGLDLVSPYPRQEAGTLSERLVQPLLQWSWLTFLPLRLAERTSRASLGAANGQFLLVDRAAYDRAGGHTAVRGEILDDLALLRAIKAVGGHGTVVDGTQMATCRMYDSGADLRDGYRKSLWSALGRPAGAAATLSMLIVAYVVPAVAAVLGSRVGAVGYAAGVVGRIVTARRTGGRAWPDAAAHPASILQLAVLTAQSLARHRRGTLRWRGRTLPGRTLQGSALQGSGK